MFEFLEWWSRDAAVFYSMWPESNFESSLTIVAENGTVKVGGQYMNEVEYCNIRGYEMPELPPSNPANDYGHYKGSAANHGYVFQNVFETLRGVREDFNQCLGGPQGCGHH